MARTGKLTSLVTDEDSKLSQRRSLSTETADKLRELILLEKLPPGMHIPERDLSEALGISRTPMREALRILEAEGLVDHTPTRRSRVANPSVEELSQSMKVLATLEALGGELACTHADEAQLEAISDLNRRMHEESGKASSKIQRAALARAFPVIPPHAGPCDDIAAASGHYRLTAGAKRRERRRSHANPYRDGDRKSGDAER